MNDFQTKLKQARRREKILKAYFINRGYAVCQTEEGLSGQYKGPRIDTPDGELIKPDLFLMKWKDDGPRVFWIDVKDKAVFTWHRITSCWCTGIDTRCYESYTALATGSGVHVFLFFLHEISTPNAIDLAYPECPKQCPTGLFLVNVMTPINHSFKGGNNGLPMVYWAHAQLKKIIEIKELKEIVGEELFDDK